MATAVVTGAARGLGVEFVRQLAARGERVLALCRRSSAELLDVVHACGGAERVAVVEGVDVAHDDGFAAAATWLRDHRATVSTLVCNAGVIDRSGLDALGDFSAVRSVFEVNVIGVLRTVLCCRPFMRSDGASRVVVISSVLGSIAENETGGRYPYRIAKAALNMASKSLAVDLKPSGVGVFIFHPGHVRTDMGGSGAPVEPTQSVAGVLAKLGTLTLADTGTFWSHTGAPIKW